MPKGLSIERWTEWMNANLNMFFKKSKSTSSWNSIKKFEHDKNEYGKWKAYKAIMISKKAS